MTSERWQRIESLFAQAIEYPLRERQPFVDRVCEGDEALKRELESLLASDAPDEYLIEVPSLLGDRTAADPEPDSDLTGRRIGPYRLMRLIGHGGMGSVYLGVRDDDQYRKQVAIKLLNRGMDTDFMLSRFRQERQILAGLEHPFIARLMDGGATDEGLPYFVMEYVDGVPITDYCAEKKLSIMECLRLFRLVCEAVQYAHQNLVVHRDIKPSNILTTREGIPKLLDFGIAKVIDPGTSPGVTYTQREVRMMTPDYASPEQVKGLQISTASDIYSLGAILYELLTGERAQHVPTGSLSDIEKTICETDPPKPSLKGDKSLRRRLSGDLDNIVLTAMRKEPARRYASAAEFSEDLRRHMEGLPIVAHEDRWSYRARKFIRRNRLAVGAALLVAASLIVGMVTTTIQARRAERRFLLARQLAQAVVAEVGNHGTLGRVAGSTAARATLIQTVIRYLDGLAQDPGRDPLFQLEIANTYRSTADVEGSPFQPNLGRPAAALSHYQKALEIYERLVSVSADGSDVKRRALDGLVGVNIQAGDIEVRTANRDSAKARLQRAVSAASDASARDSNALSPDTWVWLYFRLGVFAMREGSTQQGLDHYRKALEICIPWAAKDPAVNARNTLRAAYVNMAAAQMMNGDLQGALGNYTLALRRTEEAVRLPDSTVFEKTALALGHSYLGDILGHPAVFNFGDRAGAISHYRQTVAMDEALAAADPDDVRARDDLANAYSDLASIQIEEQPEEALRTFQRSAAIARELTSGVPSFTKYRQTLALSQIGIGEALLKLGRYREALEHLAPALDMMKSHVVVADDPIRASARVSQIHSGMGAGLLALGREAEALEHLRQALVVTDGLVKKAPASLYVLRYRADVHESFGKYYDAVARRQREHRAEARAWVQKSLDMWQDWVRRKIAVPYSSLRERQAAALLSFIDKP